MENRAVYINYAFEDVPFRWENGGNLYRKFYGEAETRIPMDNKLFHDAISGGEEITAEEYAQL